MEAYVSDVESEGSGISNPAYSLTEDGPGPSQNGESVIVSDESDYSGVTNEDDEDLQDDEEMEWPPKDEYELLPIKEEEFSADEEMYLAEGVQVEELLPVKEEVFSDVSDAGFAGFDESAAKRRRGLTGVNFTEREEDEEEDDYDYGGATVKIEEFFSQDYGGGTVKVEEAFPQDAEVASLPLGSSNDFPPDGSVTSPSLHTSSTNSRNRCVPIKRRAKRPKGPITTKIFHCYYCPQVFRFKAYLPRHVLQHLKDGDPKYEVTNSYGKNVHPAYVQGTVWPVPQNKRNQQRPLKSWWGKKLKVYHCYYCPVPFRFKAYLSSHVLGHLARGDPKFEVRDSSGNMVHPAYLEEERKLSRSKKNKTQRNASHSGDKTYACHLCDFKTKYLNVLRTHLKLKAKQALRPKTFTCSHCGWTTSKEVYLESHMRRHIPKEYKCEYCSYRAHTPYRLEIHVRVHTGEKPYKCEFCDERFSERCHQKKHLLTHKSRIHSCPHCTFSAANGTILTEHIINIHLGSANYGCPKCNFATDDATTLRSHVRSIHGMKLEKLKCRWCDFEAARSTTLRIHERTHTEPEGYACEECAFTTKSKYSLKAHMWTHTGEKPFACNLCDYRSTAKKTVMRHMVIHSDEKPFKCTHCDSKFKTKQSAQYHEYYVHRLVDKRYRCQYCDYEAYHKKTVKVHESSHTGEKTFACPECDFVGRLKINLKTHMRTHARGGDHKCDYCNFRSTSAVGISSHIQTVHPTAKPYMCSYCSATFKYKPELIDHEREHTGEKKRPRRKGLVYKRFKCRFCDFETIPFKKIKSHYEEAHPDKIKTEIIPELAEREAQNPVGFKKGPKTKRKCRFCSFESTLRRKVRIHEQIHTYEMMGRIGDKVMKM